MKMAGPPIRSGGRPLDWPGASCGPIPDSPASDGATEGSGMPRPPTLASWTPAGSIHDPGRAPSGSWQNRPRSPAARRQAGWVWLQEKAMVVGSKSAARLLPPGRFWRKPDRILGRVDALPRRLPANVPVKSLMKVHPCSRRVDRFTDGSRLGVQRTVFAGVVNQKSLTLSPGFHFPQSLPRRNVANSLLKRSGKRPRVEAAPAGAAHGR
jgi:hypothetical protein